MVGIWKKIVFWSVLSSTSIFAVDLIQPADPKVLLQVLPKQIEGLALQTSVGELSLDAWLKSHATRVFSGTKILHDKPVNFEVTIELTDSALNPQTLGEFRDFRPITVENYEKKWIANQPASVLKSEDHQIQVRVLLLNRYIVNFSLPKDELGREEEWLKRIDINKLGSLKTEKYKEYPRVVLLSYVDELNVQNQREYEATVPNPEAQKKHLKELEALEKSGTQDP